MVGSILVVLLIAVLLIVSSSEAYQADNTVLECATREEETSVDCDIGNVQNPLSTSWYSKDPTEECLRNQTVVSIDGIVASENASCSSFGESRPTLIRTNQTTTVLGFLRIQKTGSTSVLSFLGLASGLHSWDNFIYSASDFLENTESNLPERQPFCIYGHATNKDMPLTFDHDINDGDNSYELEGPRTSHFRCPHIPLETLMETWHETRHATNHPVGTELSFQAFTMIRDPYDRLKSLFFFVRKFCGSTSAWQGMFYEAEYNQVCFGTFPGFLQVLHDADGWRRKQEKIGWRRKPPSFEDWLELIDEEEWWSFSDGWKRTGIPYQFPFLNEDLHVAISMIEGDTPDVLVLLNECFEESLLLLQHKFHLKPGAVETFAASPEYRMNTSTKKDLDDESELRAMAETWFRRDYKFYQAATRQFRHELASIDLDPESLNNPCFIWEQEEPPQ